MYVAVLSVCAILPLCLYALCHALLAVHVAAQLYCRHAFGLHHAAGVVGIYRVNLKIQPSAFVKRLHRKARYGAVEQQRVASGTNRAV